MEFKKYTIWYLKFALDFEALFKTRWIYNWNEAKLPGESRPCDSQKCSNFALKLQWKKLCLDALSLWRKYAKMLKSTNRQRAFRTRNPTYVVPNPLISRFLRLSVKLSALLYLTQKLTTISTQSALLLWHCILDHKVGVAGGESTLLRRKKEKIWPKTSKTVRKTNHIFISIICRNFFYRPFGKAKEKGQEGAVMSKAPVQTASNQGLAVPQLQVEGGSLGRCRGGPYNCHYAGASR